RRGRFRAGRGMGRVLPRPFRGPDGRGGLAASPQGSAGRLRAPRADLRVPHAPGSGARAVVRRPRQPKGREPPTGRPRRDRAPREIFGGLLGPRFDALLAEKPYFAMGAYDNLLLGTLYRDVFGSPFAPGDGGEHLARSATEDVLRAALSRMTDLTDLARF